MRRHRTFGLAAATALLTISGIAVTPAGATMPPVGSSDAILKYQWSTASTSNYDPHRAFNQLVNIFLYPVYDRLTELTPDGELVPMLAESWELTNDNTVLHMTLRDDVVFHDGTPFNAEAVKANIERGQTIEASAVKADLAPIESVVVVDELTVDFHLSSPAAALPALLSDRAGMMISPAAFENENLDLMPVGTGPYQAVEHEPGSFIRYERFAEYWNPDAQGLGGLEISMQLDPEARLRAMADGQVNGTTLNPDQAAAAERAGLDVTTTDGSGAFMLFVNMAAPGVDNVEVRKAISMAIDRQGLVDGLFGGRCKPTNQIFPTGYWASSPDVAVDPYDPDGARELLQSAGVENLELEAIVPNVAFYTAGLEAIQAMLEEVGIHLTVTALEPSELLARFSSGDAALYFSQYPGSVDPAKTVTSLFSSDAQLNPGHYSNVEVDALATQGLSVVGRDERAPIYQQLSHAAASDYFHIPICSPQSVWAIDASVQNFVPTIGGSVDFRGVTLADG